MKQGLHILLFVILSCTLCAQEVLLPLRVDEQHPILPKSIEHSLPFFDDFSNPALSQQLWEQGGALVNQGYAPLPPTLGMATLDAFDAQGQLYPTAVGELFPADTLCSLPVRLDSLFSPVVRPLSVGDSVYLSFFYLPGGGYGNRWEGVGDTPQGMDSLVVDFFSPADNAWHTMWSRPGISADSLFARTGHYWQYVEIPILDDAYLQPGFRFRFRNYCSLNPQNKKGILSNSDQWNIDYVLLNSARHRGDSTFRDIAFVNPATSMLRHYQAIPFRHYRPSHMRDTLSLQISNLFSQELAYSYGYKILDENGIEQHVYDGGYENVPVFWLQHSYQTSAAHAWPALDYAFPSLSAPTHYSIVHGIREGVSGDVHPQNDTICFTQVFDNYFAYDDGTAENGYGVTSTDAKVKFACRFDLNQEDTLTAVHLYFNNTYQHQNADVRFYLTVWDDNQGQPGNIIYKDSQRRSPQFQGLNQYVRYVLDEGVVCQGSIYVGLEQTTADYINLGFDRNNDASSRLFTHTSASWQPSILRGALMLRPYFGQRATLGATSPDFAPVSASVINGSVVVKSADNQPISIYDIHGRKMCQLTPSPVQNVSPRLPRGVYFVRVGMHPAQKVIVL